MRPKAAAIAALLALALGGCAGAIQPLAMSLAGAGTSSAVSHGLSGVAYRTFTGTAKQVREAVLDALANMGIKVDATLTVEGSEVIQGSAWRRTVEVELEPITKKATRMRVVTRNGGIFPDASTATEIVLQTERSLGVNDVTNASTGASARRRK